MFRLLHVLFMMTNSSYRRALLLSTTTNCTHRACSCRRYVNHLLRLVDFSLDLLRSNIRSLIIQRNYKMAENGTPSRKFFKYDPTKPPDDPDEAPYQYICIIVSTNAPKNHVWTNFYRYLCDQYFNRYELLKKFEKKFDQRKKEICQEIIDELFPGKFVHKKEDGQWYVLSNAQAQEKIMQRFDHIRRNVKKGIAPSIDASFSRSAQISDKDLSAFLDGIDLDDDDEDIQTFLDGIDLDDGDDFGA